MAAKKARKRKNRYMRNAKLSEYRFLKVLRGFAADYTAKELARDSGISAKTIRATYRVLRNKLIEAAIYNRKGFGGAGLYLLRKGRLDAQGKRFLKGVAESDLFQRHVERHAPRLNSEEDLQGLVFEVAIRTFCNIHIAEGTFIDYPDKTKEAVENLRDISQWIRENLPKEGFVERYGHIIEQFRKVSEGMRLLLEKEELLALKSRSREHRYPWDLLYNDLRRFLSKHPM